MGKHCQNQIIPSYESSLHEVYRQALTVGLCSLQAEIELNALNIGRYPSHEYTNYSTNLLRVLGLDWDRKAESITHSAFQAPNFRRSFIDNCKAMTQIGWPGDKSAAEVESKILEDFVVLTEGSKSSLKVYSLCREIWGKAHVTSAALTAVQGHYFKPQKFRNGDQQSMAFRVTEGISKGWHKMHPTKWRL